MKPYIKLALISLLSSTLTHAHAQNSGEHHHHHDKTHHHATHNTHQPTTDFGKAYLDSMAGMHHDMEQAAYENDADISFAKGMIAHHEGAVEMAKIQLQYGKDPEMRKLAEQIIAAQEPEIQQMQQWLQKHSQQTE